MKAKGNPKSALGWFAVASNLDGQGKEVGAKLAYEKVVEIGIDRLSSRNQCFFYLQYGSTLRNCGYFAKSESISRTGIRRFPDFQALKLFLALSQISRKKNNEAIKTLFRVLIENRPDRSIKLFERALRHYVKKL